MTSLVNAMDLYMSRVGYLVGNLVRLIFICSSEIYDPSDYQCPTKNDLIVFTIDLWLFKGLSPSKIEAPP